MGPKSHEKFLGKLTIYDKTVTKEAFIFTDVDPLIEEYRYLKESIYIQMTPWERQSWISEKSYFEQINEISSKFLHIDENPTLSLKMTKLEKSEFVRGELTKIAKTFQFCCKKREHIHADST